MVGKPTATRGQRLLFFTTFVLHVAHCCFIFFFSSRKSKEIVENKKNIYVYVYMILRYVYIII